MRRNRPQRAWPLLALLAAGCATQPQPPASPPSPAAAGDNCEAAPTFAAGGERATLWVRRSAEFRAASESTYRAALAALEKGLADTAWTAEPTQAGDMSGAAAGGRHGHRRNRARQLRAAGADALDGPALQESRPRGRRVARRTAPPSPVPPSSSRGACDEGSRGPGPSVFSHHQPPMRAP